MSTRRLRAVALRLALALLPVAPALMACDKELTETEVPAGGVTLRYALSPGAVYSGHITQRESVGSAGQALKRRLDFDAAITVRSVNEAGVARVEAKISNLNLDWALPGAAGTVINIDDFVASMTARLEGVTIPFSIEPSGKVTEVPPMAEEITEQESVVVNTVIDGLTRAFFVVPDGPLERGQQWSEKDSRGRKGKLGRFSEWTTDTRFDGLYDYRPSGATDELPVAKLTIETDKTEVTTTKEGGHEIKLRSKTVALFNVSGGYLAKIDGTDTKYDGPDMSTVKFSASFQQARAGAATMVQSVSDPCDADYVGAEVCADAVQTITDPCDPDYVGGEDCPDDDPAAAPGTDGGEASPEGKAATGEDAAGARDAAAESSRAG